MKSPALEERDDMRCKWQIPLRTKLNGLALVLTLMTVGSIWCRADDDFGTIGVRFDQLYDDAQPKQHGPLVVLDVVAGLSGDKAGIHKGDLVFAIDGALVMGKSLEEINRKVLRGPVGSSVRLSFVRLDGSQYELTVPRVAYPRQTNPASDPFGYSISGSWRIDPRYAFPLPWAPSIAYHGIEDVAFAPDSDFSDSPEYHSYLFFWWLDGTTAFTAKQLEADMVVYFQGLAEQRGRNNGFKPDVTKIAASYHDDPAGAHTLGGAAGRSFQGIVNIYDTHGKIITLNSEVVASACPGTNHTAVFFGMSQQPRQEPIWRHIDEVRDSFRCIR
jgi:hypothetical protein